MDQVYYRDTAAARLHWRRVGALAGDPRQWQRGFDMGAVSGRSRLLDCDLLAVAQTDVGLRVRP